MVALPLYGARVDVDPGLMPLWDTAQNLRIDPVRRRLLDAGKAPRSRAASSWNTV